MFDQLRHAQKVIFDNGNGPRTAIKPKSLRKFGANFSVGTTEATIMQLPAGVSTETYATGNDIDSFVCDDNSFTEDVTVEGHTVDGNGDLAFVSQTFTATGTTPVTLATPMHRTTRCTNDGAAMPASSTAYFYRSGDTTVTSGTPNTGSAVNLMMTAAHNRSLKASTSFSSQDYFLITRLDASVAKKTQGGAIVYLRIRERDGAFQTRWIKGINSLGASGILQLDVPIIVKPNSDVAFFAEADSASTTITAEMEGYFALINGEESLPDLIPIFNR
jgi:hypothetical protein